MWKSKFADKKTADNEAHQYNETKWVWSTHIKTLLEDIAMETPNFNYYCNCQETIWAFSLWEYFQSNVVN